MSVEQQNPEGTPEQPSSILDKESWHKAAKEAFAAARASGKPLSVIFLDVNSFKQINDNLGHSEGDIVIEDLKQLIPLVVSRLRTDPKAREEIDLISLPDFSEGAPIERPTRSVDAVEAQAGHVGGDEFSVLVHTDQIRIIKARLIEAFLEYLNDPAHPERDAYKKLGMGFAIGTSTLTPDMTSCSELLQAADSDMYEDKISQLKELGRLGRIMFWVGNGALKLSGVEARDVEKYRKKYDY